MRESTPPRETAWGEEFEHINVHPAVRHTETQLVFEEMQGAGVLYQAKDGTAARRVSGRLSPDR